METPPTIPRTVQYDEKVRTRNASDAWWSLLGLLHRRRKFALTIVGLVAIGSLVISLLLPKWYMSTARVMIPEPTGGGTLSALLGDLDPAAAALLGGSGGDYIRYMAILTSRTMSDKVIREFDLMKVYDTADSPRPWMDTREALEDNVEFEVDREFDFLSISVLDKDPAVAAEMANFYVQELNTMNAGLVSENATNYREFVEKRYEETEANLDSAMSVLQLYQEEHGLVELEQQAQAFLTVLAEYRASAFQAEVEYEALALDFGKDNPSVRSAYNRVKAAATKEQELLDGKDPLMPVAMKDVPGIAHGYAKALREVLIFEKIIEFARPLLEQAIFEEQKETHAVQVLDHPEVPEWKTKPKRAWIVLGSTMTAVILVVLYLLMADWLSRNRSYMARRFESELTQNT